MARVISETGVRFLDGNDKDQDWDDDRRADGLASSAEVLGVVPGGG